MSPQAPGNNSLALYGNTLLRAAVRRNLVTFPAQIPVFMKPPSGYLQQRAVQLYFVRGWSVRSICNRYDLGKKIVQNLLLDWRVRAISAGLIQEIRAEDLERLALEYQAPERQASEYQAPEYQAPEYQAVDKEEQAAGQLMILLKEECVELGIELSLEQTRKIERIVRDAVRPGVNSAAAAHHGVTSFDLRTDDAEKIAGPKAHSHAVC